MTTSQLSSPGRVGAILIALALVLAACGGSGAPASGVAATNAPATGAAGTGSAGGPMTGKRLCELVTLEKATELLGEAPPRGEASDDRLAKSHTCAYKPGPKLILQIVVIEGFPDVASFDKSMERFTVKTPAEGVGDKAFFVARTEPPAGTRLYALAKGVTVLVNIGSDKQTEEALQTVARDLIPTVIDAL